MARTETGHEDCVDDPRQWFRLDGRRILVTGGSRGIGRMIAEALVRSGAAVVISSRDPEACARAVTDLEEYGDISAIPADLSDDGECHRLARAVSEGGVLHGLVNNAGATWGASLEQFPTSAWEKVLRLNLITPFTLTRELVPSLAEASVPHFPSTVINLGSIDGMRAPALETYSYTASKAGIHHMTRHLARHLGPRGITVNAVAAGPFRTRMTAATIDRDEQEYLNQSPLSRLGRPADIGGPVVFLASRAASYMTGAVIPVDGGIYAAG